MRQNLHVKSSRLAELVDGNTRAGIEFSPLLRLSGLQATIRLMMITWKRKKLGVTDEEVKLGVKEKLLSLPLCVDMYLHVHIL